MTQIMERVLKVPEELIKHCPGLAFDFGASLIKVIYRSKEDVKDNDSSGNFVTLRLVSFEVREIGECLKYVKERVPLVLSGAEPTTIYTTGVSAMQFEQLVRDQLNLNLINKTEGVCTVESFIYLSSKLPRSDLLEPFQMDAGMLPVGQTQLVDLCLDSCVGEETSRCHIRLETVNTSAVYTPDQVLGHVTAPSTNQPLDKEEDIYPCAMIMAGSAIAVFLVNRDGSYTFDVTTRGGKVLEGLGSLLLAYKDFDELLEMAARGDRSKVDTCTDSLPNMSTVDDVYTKMSQNGLVLFNLGKCVDKKLGDLEREDIARALVHLVVDDMVDWLYDKCVAAGVKRIFFFGSLVAPPLVRSIVTTELVRRNINRVKHADGEALYFDFIKPGAYLGALGAMVLQMDAPKHQLYTNKFK